MWLIHEHNTDGSAIDKYWLFKSKEKALKSFLEVVKDYRPNIDPRLYSDLYNDSSCDQKITMIDKFIDEYINNIDGPTIVDLYDSNYLVLTDIGADGSGRRP